MTAATLILAAALLVGGCMGVAIGLWSEARRERRAPPAPKPTTTPKPAGPYRVAAPRDPDGAEVIVHSIDLRMWSDPGWREISARSSIERIADALRGCGIPDQYATSTAKRMYEDWLRKVEAESDDDAASAQDLVSSQWGSGS